MQANFLYRDGGWRGYGALYLVLSQRYAKSTPGIPRGAFSVALKLSAL